MKPPTYITTSWDDGHSLDLRVADLLARYGLRGTFYVPESSEYGTMTPAQVRELSRGFEIGAHTVHHVDLGLATAEEANREIVDSRSWVEDVTGLPCPMFCPPKGKFSRRDLASIRNAGYRGIRSVELLSLDFPREDADLVLMPTTIQAHPHGPLAYARNAIKRGAVGNLWRYVALGCPADWTELARSALTRAIERGGVFHLWGHSWELERTGQWQRLEEVLRFMGRFTAEAPALTNGEVCNPGVVRSIQVAPNGGSVP
jgi:hypothetical protein